MTSSPTTTDRDARVMRDVVITGVGAITPLGVGARTLHERWLAGETGIEAGEGACSAFAPTDFLSGKEARRADRFTQLAIGAGAEALADAGWDDGLPYDPERIGAVIGTGIGGIGTIEDNHDVLRDRGTRAVSPLAVPLMMGNAGAAALSLRHAPRRPAVAAPRPARPRLRRHVGLRRRLARDRHSAADDPARRGRRRRNRRLG